MTSNSSPRLGMALFAAFSVLWVLVEEVLGGLMQHAYPLPQVVWCRYAVHLLLMLGLFVWRKPQRLWRTRRLTFQLLRSMLMLVMPLSFLGSRYAGAPANMTWSVFWVAPVLVLVIAARWMPEPSDRTVATRAWWLCACCALAAALMLWPRQWPPPGVWPLAAGAMALSFAIYVVMTRSLRTEAVEANLFYTALGVFLVLTPFMPAMWVMPSMHDAAVLFGIGALGLVGLWVLDRAAAVAPLPLSAAGLYAYLPTLAATGWWLHGATATRRWVAFALIASALIYLWQQLPRAAPRRALQV